MRAREARERLGKVVKDGNLHPEAMHVLVQQCDEVSYLNHRVDELTQLCNMMVETLDHLGIATQGIQNQLAQGKRMGDEEGVDVDSTPPEDQPRVQTNTDNE